MRLVSTLVLYLLASPLVWSTDPVTLPVELRAPAPGVKVLGQSAPKAPSPTDTVEVAPGRFIPIVPIDGSPCYIAPSRAYRVYSVAKGGQYTGVKFDADPTVVEPETYSWSDVSGPIYVILVRNAPGSHSIQLLKNGPDKGPPMENGQPFLIRISGTVPPTPAPVPTPIPVVPTPVVPTPDDSAKRGIIAGEGLHVLIVYDPLDAKITAGQRSALTGKTVRDYLDAKASNGNYRIWPVQEDYTGAPQIWKDAMALPRQNVPWLVVSNNGRGSFQGPLPKTAEETLSILKKYGE